MRIASLPRDGNPRAYTPDGERRWSAMPWPSSGQLSRLDCQWAPRCLLKGYFMCSWRACPADFTGEPRLHLRLYYRHHGPPAAVYGEHGDRRTAGDAKPHPRQFWFIDEALERGSAGKYHRHGHRGRHLNICRYLMNPPDAFVKIGMDVMKTRRSKCFQMPSSLGGLSPQWCGCSLLPVALKSW